MPGLDQTAVRRVNTTVVLRALAATGDHTTLKDLVGQTGLSRRTIELILGQLTTEGWARESLSESGGAAGRPARRFHFTADHHVVGAARIDTHLAHAAVADLNGRILGTATRALSDYQHPRIAVADAATALEAAAADAGTGLDRLCVGAVAAGGVIDPEGFVRRLINAPAWSDFHLADAFAEHFQVPWFADNDANLAALAEHWSGVAQGRRHIAWLIHGYRTGVGLIINGEVHRGAFGGAGELIESRVLGMRHSEEHPFGMLVSPLAEDRAKARTLVLAALADDREALALAEGFAAEIADAVDVLAWTVAPELVVLGGGLEAGAELLVPLVRARLRETGALETELNWTSIGTEAPLVGAVRYALDRIDGELYGPVLA